MAYRLQDAQMIPSRRNAGTFTKSSTNPKSAAAAKTMAGTATETARISIPLRASAEIIMMSATVAMTIHLLGADFHRWRRSRTQ